MSENIAATPSAPIATWQLWTGRVLSAIPVVMLGGSGTAKILGAQQIMDNMTEKFGYPAKLAAVIGVLEVACALVYAVPKTTYLGAILVTGYLGGAIATHVRVGDPGFPAPLFLGIFAWLGLYLRDRRLRDLTPLVRS